MYRWFVGMNLDESVWDVTVLTKNRDRLLDGEALLENDGDGSAPSRSPER